MATIGDPDMIRDHVLRARVGESSSQYGFYAAGGEYAEDTGEAGRVLAIVESPDDVAPMDAVSWLREHSHGVLVPWEFRKGSGGVVGRSESRNKGCSR